jgi:hypothetical protein
MLVLWVEFEKLFLLFGTNLLAEKPRRPQAESRPSRDVQLNVFRFFRVPEGKLVLLATVRVSSRSKREAAGFPALGWRLATTHVIEQQSLRRSKETVSAK